MKAATKRIKRLIKSQQEYELGVAEFDTIIDMIRELLIASDCKLLWVHDAYDVASRMIAWSFAEQFGV